LTLASCWTGHRSSAGPRTSRKTCRLARRPSQLENPELEVLLEPAHDAPVAWVARPCGWQRSGALGVARAGWQSRC